MKNYNSKLKICTPVIGKTLNEILKNLDKVQEITEMVELRVDYINNLTEKDLKIIREQTIKESIFTCRKRSEGGLYQGDERSRIKIIRQACGLGFDYVDIELSSIKYFDLPLDEKSKIILSFHNFKKTPTVTELQIIRNRMRFCRPDIMKLATMVKKEEDIKVLLRLLLEKEKDEKMIVLGIGEKGKITRILGPIMGNYLTYAATDYGQSTQGQIDVFDLKKIYKFLTFHF